MDFEIQVKRRGMYLSFDFGWYSIHLDIEQHGLGEGVCLMDIYLSVTKTIYICQQQSLIDFGNFYIS